MQQTQVKIVDRAEAPLCVAEAMAFVSDPAFGGINIFVGKVRDFNQGRPVTGIHYDMFRPLVLARFGQIADEAMLRFGPSIRVYVAHAFGRLAIDDLAVIVAVATPHRDEAYRASRDIIEAVKHTSPIWKQEHYLDGESAWSEGCTLCESGHARSSDE